MTYLHRDNKNEGLTDREGVKIGERGGELREKFTSKNICRFLIFREYFLEAFCIIIIYFAILFFIFLF